MDLNLIVKPTHLCNFSCKYCYNEDDRFSIMDMQTLTHLIQKAFQYSEETQKFEKINFIWHGGEPLICEIDFYREAVHLQKKYNKNISFKNTVQTNGSLINEKWIDFFQKNNFKVSISLDGPRDIHNLTRVYPDGTGTFDQVMKGINLIKQTTIKLGVVLVITKLNKDKASEIYDFFAKEKLNFQVVPLTKQGSALKNFIDLGLESKEYADPWIKMFDRWFESSDDEYIYCKDFMNKAVGLYGKKCIDCASMEQCGVGFISIDPKGYVYPCSTFSAKPHWCFGNININNFKELMNSHAAKQSTNRQTDSICMNCTWKTTCNGGCPSRAYNFYETIHHRDYYCPSLQKIYRHISAKINARIEKSENRN